MAVRVRLRVEGGRRVREVAALVNSGYEADTPQLIVPAGLRGSWASGLPLRTRGRSSSTRLEGL
jgi:hypothetical protein